MQGPHLRKYGVEAKIDFVLYEVDGVDLRVDAADAGSDCSIMKDEGAEATCDNDFVDEGKGYSITLTATEMEAARIVVYVIDSATKVWLDDSLHIETYGNAAAQHAFDLDTAATAMRGTDNAALASVVGALADAAAAGEVTEADTLMQYLKQLINILIGTPGIGAFPASAAPANAISLAEVIRAIYDDTNALQTDLVDGGRLDLLIDAIKVVTDNQAAASTTLITGTVSHDNEVATTTVIYSNDVTEATADHYNGRLFVPTSGALVGQYTDITDYELENGEGKFTVTALTEAPADDTTFVII